jgi:hypothetical protein
MNFTWILAFIRGHRPPRRRAITAIMLICSVWFSGASVANAMECAMPHARSSGDVIKETKRTIDQLSTTFSKRGTGSIPTIIFALRQKYPNVTDAELTNYLITAYCPAVNRKFALSDSEKRTELKRFINQVSAQLP